MNFLEIASILSLSGFFNFDKPYFTVQEAHDQLHIYSKVVNKVYHNQKIPSAEIEHVINAEIEHFTGETKQELIKRDLLLSIQKRVFARLQLGGPLPADLTDQLWHPVPTPLSYGNQQFGEFEASSIFYLSSLQQPNSWSCGFLALFSAAALRDVIANRHCVDLIELQRLVYHYYETVGFQRCINYLLEHHAQAWKDKDEIPRQEVSPLDKHIYAQINNPVFHFNNDVFVLMNLDGQVWPIHLCLDENNDAAEEKIAARKQFFAALGQRMNEWIETNRRDALHFVCFLRWPTEEQDSCHWILISVVKLNNRNPFLVMLDSINKPLASYNNFKENINHYSLPASYLIYLYNLLVHPYLNFAKNK